jgi:hypothetical protein
MQYNISDFPPSFLPTGVDASSLIDITTIGDTFRVYVDPNSNKVYNGAQLYKEHMECKKYD